MGEGRIRLSLENLDSIKTNVLHMLSVCLYHDMVSSILTPI